MPGRPLRAPGWRATRTFTLTRHVPHAPPVLLDFLMDLSRHRGLHPYLVSAEVIASGRSASGRWQEWLVRERPRLGPVGYPVRFRVRTTRTSSTSMESELAVRPGCRLHGRIHAVVDAEGVTTLTETVEVSAPRLIVGYVVRHARLAHEHTLTRLPTNLG